MSDTCCLWENKLSYVLREGGGWRGEELMGGGGSWGWGEEGGQRW